MKMGDKLKALEAAILQIDKEYGKGTVMKLGENTHMEIESIPTGSLGLDMALGVGGIPKGRIVEVYGVESGGKTTLTLHMIAEAQKMGGLCAFIDAEHALDPKYAKALGVDIDNLYICQPNCGEEALDVCDKLVSSGALDLIVVDSVAALVPKAELEGEMGDQQVGLQARLMSKGMRKLTASASKMNCTIVFINQLREKIGVMFGNPSTTTGGRALKFYSSVRIEVTRLSSNKSAGEIVSNHTRAKVVKNKVAPPFREAEFDICFGKGIDQIGEIIEMATKMGIVEKAGAWYSYQGSNVGQGLEKTKAYFESHPEQLSEIKEAVINHIKDEEEPI